MRTRPIRAAFWLALPLVFSACLPAQDPRGRKYTPPPAVAHVTVTVSKQSNNKPVESAAVIFHTFHNGKDQGNLEVKTNEEGVAVIDVIPIGDLVRLQVIKSGFQTFGEDYTIDGATKALVVKLKPPVRQYSIYDKAASGQPESSPNTPAPSTGTGKPPQ